MPKIPRFALHYLVLSALTFGAFIAPSAAFSAVFDFYTFRFELEFLAAFISAALIFPLVKPRALAIGVFVAFAAMEIVQFSHIFYFHTPLNVFSLSLMFGEWGEIFESAKIALPWGLCHIFVIIFVYGFLCVLYAKLPRKTSAAASVFIVLMLCILPHKALFKTPRIANFMPRNDSVSILNSLRVFNAYFFIYLKNQNKTPRNYAPYEVSQFEVGERNVVVILGESVNGNHIGLLGYERETTPKLRDLRQNDPNFIAKKAISSAVLTKVSLQSFINIAYNPDNVGHILSQKTHLFRLAKMAGFRTFYISNQTNAEAIAMQPSYIDVFSTKEDYLLKSAQVGDLVLLEELQKFRFDSGKNFIVIHQRNPHSPYESGYRAYKEAEVFALSGLSETARRINAYDNAMIFNDHIIDSVFRHFKAAKIPSFVLFTPDHGEAMGEIGKNGGAEFGHAFLSHNVAQIPLFASAYNAGGEAAYGGGGFIDKLKSMENPTHYEIGLLLAQMLGFSVKNPSEIPDTFYINGTDIAGNGGYIEVKKRGGRLDFIYR